MASIEIRENTKGTSYKVVWYDQDGKKKSKTWADESRAELWKSLIESVNGDAAAAARALARQSSNAKTVNQVSDHRLGLVRATSFTKQTYESYMRNHISPAFGDWPIDSVTEDDCRRFILQLEAKGLSAKYIGNIGGWLTSIMIHAAERKWRAGNPMNPEMLPEVTVTDVEEENKFLTRAEAYAVIERMPKRYQLPALLILGTGLRPSEMRALKVSDVHLHAKFPAVRVTKAIKQDRAKGSYVGPPKSQRAVRSAGLPDSLIPVMRAYVEGRSESEYLFPGQSGQWMGEESFYQAFMKGARQARKEGVLDKWPAPYALRHSHASMMVDAGMDIYKLSRHMGHSSVQTTEKVYLHLYPDAVFQAAKYATAAIGTLPLLEG